MSRARCRTTTARSSWAARRTGREARRAVLQLEDGGALKITNAKWYTPAGRSIDRPHGVHAEAAPADTARPHYKTDKGRVVVGGGGIVPDVIAGDSAVSPAERAWVEAVGAKVALFREALADYSAEVVAKRLVHDPEFAVTPDMRDGLWRAMNAKHLMVARNVYDDAHEAIDRVLGTEIARQAFGIPGAQHRVVEADPVIAKAVKLLAGVREPDALLARVAQTSKSDGTR